MLATSHYFEFLRKKIKSVTEFNSFEKWQTLIVFDTCNYTRFNEFFGNFLNFIQDICKIWQTHENQCYNLKNDSEF